MSETRGSKDPKEVLEMREAMVAFRKAARGVKQSYRNLPRVTTTKPDGEGDRVDDTTKKTMAPA